MLRLFAALSSVALVATATKADLGSAHTPSLAPMSGASAPTLDVSALLAAARGAPPIICALASQSVRGYGWNGGASDAPVTPLDRRAILGENNGRALELSSTDVDRLLDALSSDDGCVRELSVQLVSRRGDDAHVANALIAKLGASDAQLRAVAALGLGLTEPQSAVDPLIRTLRDATPAARANAAWALGRIENGRALAPVVALFRDDQPIVREAAVAASGRFESTSSVNALLRVLQQDDVASVRRVAAWALGHIEANEAAPTLGVVLGRDKDAAVREMSAWALGSIESRQATPALEAALRNDSDDAVRETAAWALARVEDAGAVTALGAAAQSDRSARVRGTAAWALGQLHENNGHAPPGLLHVLRDESTDARLKAAWALGQIGDAAALPAIQDALKVEQNADVRRALVRALTKSGGHSEAVLGELLASKDPQVREAAVRGLAGRGTFNPWPWPWPRPRPFP